MAGFAPLQRDSRSGDSHRAPRPKYYKVCILPPGVIEELLALVFDNPDLLDHNDFFHRNAGSEFARLMDVHGIRAHVAPIMDELMPKSFRSIGVSMLSRVHDTTGVSACAADGVLECAKLQLGHSDASTGSTRTYLANVLGADDADVDAAYVAHGLARAPRRIDTTAGKMVTG